MIRYVKIDYKNDGFPRFYGQLDSFSVENGNLKHYLIVSFDCSLTVASGPWSATWFENWGLIIPTMTYIQGRCRISLTSRYAFDY